jgi:hypothetical protein
MELQNQEELMKNRNYRQGEKMNNEDRRLIIETLSEVKEIKVEMREFMGEMREFKEHITGQVDKLEKKEGERSKERLSVFSILIATGALAVSIIVNFFKNGG